LVLQKALAGEETSNYEFPLYTKDNQRVMVLLNATTRRNTKGDIVGVVGVGQDITELDSSRTETERVAQDLTLFIDTANAPIFGIDAHGNVNEWNQKSAEITGFSKDEVRGKHLVEEFITADYRESVDLVLQKALAGEETSNYEFPLYTKDNQRVMVLLNATTRRNTKGDIVGVVGVGQDITELDSSRAEMEYKVTERTRELNAILTLSPDGFLLSNTDNNIVYVNPAFLAMTGLEADALIDKGTHVFNELMTDLTDPQHINEINFITNGETKQLIYLLRPSSRILHVNHKIMLGLQGEIEGHVFYFRDVTHETEVDRMKSDFLSTAAHELRTPLASIYGFSELLMHREYDKKVSHEIIETIHRQSHNLKKLLDELLDLSRIEARAGKDFSMANKSLEEIVKQSCVETEGAFKAHKVDVQSLERWPTLMFDNDKMRQVFLNLLSNACKYSPAYEHVILTTSEREKNENRQFGVSITDRGMGMTPQQFSHLGERFYRADDSGATPGSGLGVSLVKEIVSIHGGEVEFVTAQGKGMVVTVWLPIV
jgi:PAS domain S-box-containing protein